MQMVVQHMRNHRYAKRSIQLYSGWIVSYIRFHNTRHPAEMGDKEVELFLSHLVNKKNVAPATQAQRTQCVGISLSRHTRKASFLEP